MKRSRIGVAVLAATCLAAGVVAIASQADESDQDTAAEPGGEFELPASVLELSPEELAEREKSAARVDALRAAGGPENGAYIPNVPIPDETVARCARAVAEANEDSDRICRLVLLYDAGVIGPGEYSDAEASAILDKHPNPLGD